MRSTVRRRESNNATQSKRLKTIQISPTLIHLFFIVVEARELQHPFYSRKIIYLQLILLYNLQLKKKLLSLFYKKLKF